MRIIEYKKFLDSKKEVAKKDQHSLSKIDMNNSRSRL